jgi:hypothetical protein
MADDKIPIQAPPGPGAQTAQPGPQQVQIQMDATNRETVYLNFSRIHLTADEVFLDIGTFSTVVGSTGHEPIVLSHRLVMNFVTAKRLSEVLRTAVAQHEQMFGVVELDVNRRLRVPPRPPAG